MGAIPYTMDLPLDKVRLAAFGALAIRQGQLDYSLKLLIVIISGVSKEEVISALRYENSRAVRELLRKIVKEKIKSTDIALRINALINKAGEYTEKRNEIIHALWGSSLDGEAYVTEDGANFTEAPTTQFMEGIAINMYQLILEMHKARVDRGYLHEYLEGQKNNSFGRLKKTA